MGRRKSGFRLTGAAVRLLGACAIGLAGWGGLLSPPAANAQTPAQTPEPNPAGSAVAGSAAAGAAPAAAAAASGSATAGGGSGAVRRTPRAVDWRLTVDAPSPLDDLLLENLDLARYQRGVLTASSKQDSVADSQDDVSGDPVVMRVTRGELRRLLAERGYFEVVNYSFAESTWEADFSGNATPIRLANPIASQMGVMRSSLIGGLVGTLVSNLKRQTERVRVFEIGRCFQSDRQDVTGFHQPVRLAALAAGTVHPEQWGSAARPVDYFDVKGDLEALFAPRALRFERVSHPALHPGRSATVLLEGKSIGVLGELHPQWCQKYELTVPAVLFEIELAALLETPMPA
jgi:hypothetical protein